MAQPYGSARLGSDGVCAASAHAYLDRLHRLAADKSLLDADIGVFRTEAGKDLRRHADLVVGDVVERNRHRAVRHDEEVVGRNVPRMNGDDPESSCARRSERVRERGLRGGRAIDAHDDIRGRSDRLPAHDSIPAVAETFPGFRVVGIGILFAPARTPADIIQKLNAEIDVVIKDAEYQKRLQSFGFTSLPGAGTAAEIAQFMKSERDNWANVFKSVKIEPQ